MTQLAPEGYLAKRKNFQFSPERRDDQLKMRRREIKILQYYLEGKTIEALCAQYGYANEKMSRTLLKMNRMLYFRAKDRGDIVQTAPYVKLAHLQADGAFWLAKLQGCRAEMEVL